MIQHKGEIIEQRVRQSGMKISHVAEMLNMSRENLYDIFKRSDVDISKITQIGNVINYDFSLEFHKDYQMVAQEPSSHFQLSNIQIVKRLEVELGMYKDKYFMLLEQHNQLLANNFEKYFELAQLNKS
jgi:plasmid maintenance system antidote protein VapI